MEQFKFKDKMTPKERLKAYSLGQDIDRIPCIPMMGVTLSSYIGATPNQYYHPPELVLELVTESTLRIIDTFCELGVDLGFSDPVASISMISAKKYKEFAMPYTKKCIHRMKEKINYKILSPT